MAKTINFEQAEQELNAKKAKQKVYVEQAVSRVLTESHRTIKQAQQDIHEASGIRPDKSTVIRWILKGKSGIRLEAVRIGNVWVTSSEAITRFITEITAKSLAS
ncbi:MAG: DUF1580 domain-containing protein [Pirellula sp.]|jgi:hypothetical protein|nr:DUF1580 domain-containing protein [Pirellula sp.]